MQFTLWHISKREYQTYNWYNIGIALFDSMATFARLQSLDIGTALLVGRVKREASL